MTHSERIRAELDESCRVKQSFSDTLVAAMARFAEECASSIQHGHKVVFFGNGGSAADAQHLAAECVVRMNRERAGLPALALATNPSILTAAGNDYGFEMIFARQIETLVSRGDVLVAISTSGNSSNILRGVEAGKKRGAYLVGMTGQTGGALAAKVDLLINVPSGDTQRIQESHITIGHIVCSLIEQILFPASDR